MTLNIVDITPQLVPRDGWDRPLIIPKIGGVPVPHTRTTTFIDVIEDKSTLSDWKMREVLLGALAQPTILEAVRELDPADDKYKARLNELAEEAMNASGANDKREKGTELHWLSELVDQQKPLPDKVSRKDALIMASYALATADLTFSHIEYFVVMSLLGAAGTFDRRCHYAGPGPNGEPIDDWFIFDLKTGTMEYGGLKMASQLAAYSRGETYDHRVNPAPDRWLPEELEKPKSKRKENPEYKAWRKTAFTAEQAAPAYAPLAHVNQDWGIILSMPSDGESDPELYWADLTIGWETCLLAKEIRTARSRKGKALRKFEATATCR